MDDQDSYCVLCGEPGIIIFQNQPDRVHGYPGDWDIMGCRECGLYWVWPVPTHDALVSYYATYHTHGKSSAAKPSAFQHLMTTFVVQRRAFHWHLMRWLFFSGKRPLHPHVFRRIGQYLSAHLWVPSSNVSKGTLLDVGAGNGWYLRLMADLGWHVIGIEPDGEAALHAREVAKVPVITSELQSSLFEPQSFDAITLRHVIEHLPEPDAVLSTCFKLLKPGGCLVIICPNSSSLGSRHFQEYWRGWEVPRHVFMYNPENLSQLVSAIENFVVETVQTENFNAWWFYLSSVPRPHNLWSWIAALGGAFAFAIQESLLMKHDRWIGEEIVLIARKPNAQTTAS